LKGSKHLLKGSKHLLLSDFLLIKVNKPHQEAAWFSCHQCFTLLSEDINHLKRSDVKQDYLGEATVARSPFLPPIELSLLKGGSITGG
jgi:hypothetical protein